VLATGPASARADLFWDHSNPHGKVIEINPLPGGGGFEKYGYENPLTLSRANDDGGELNTELANPTPEFQVNAELPEAFAAKGEYVYYTVPSGIARLPAAGGTTELEFIRLPNTKLNAQEEWEGELATTGITVAGEYIYWTTEHGVGRAKIDGSEVTPHFITSSHTGELASGGGYVFWNSGSTIYRANLNGTEAKVVVGGGAGGLAANGSHLYFTNGRETEISRANLDGNEDESDWVTTPEGTIDQGFTASQSYLYLKIFRTSALKEGIYRLDANGSGGTLGAGDLLVEAEVGAALEHADGSLNSLAVTSEETCSLPTARIALVGLATPDLALRVESPDGAGSCSPGPVINSTGDKPEEKATKKCTTGAEITVEGKKVPECTLRAAIELVDRETPSSSPVPITFNIPGVAANSIAKISPATPLPDITVPVEINATTQPGAFAAGTRTIGAIIDGTSAGKGADGLELDEGSTGSVINGLQIQDFDDVGVVVHANKIQIADSVLTSDGSGVQVEGDEDVIGAGNALPGDIFFKDGSIQKAINFVKGNAGKKLSPGEVTLSEIGFGAGILMDHSSSGTVISGDAIGIHGPGFSAPPDELDADGFGVKSLASLNPGSIPDITPFTILIAPEKGDEVSDVTIENSELSGSLFGLEAGGTPESPVSGLTIKESKIGTETDGEPLSPFGAFLGIAVNGTVSGLRIGVPGQGNYFGGAMLGALLTGTGITSPLIQGNTFGLPRSLGSHKSDEGLEDFNGVGVVLADVQGAQVGGAGAAEGNHLNGTLLGSMILGTKDANDAIVGNRFGSDSYVPLTGLEKDNADEQFYGIVGVANLDTSGKATAAQNLTISNNSFQDLAFGTFVVEASGVNMDSNTYNGDLWDALVAATNVNIGAPSAGNLFENSPIGLVLLSTGEPTAAENQDAGVNPKADSASTRSESLSEPNENLALDVVNEDSTAEVSPASLASGSQTNGTDSIIANRFGVDSSENPAPDAVPLLVGEEPSLQFGGTAAGQGNIVEDNKASGLLIAGVHAGVQILGNRIYNNENFSSPTIPGLAGLGINLAGESGFATFGVDAQDPTQPDAGPNNVQNSPVLASAASSGGQLTVSGSLHGVASTHYLIEVFADEKQNPFGAGEGETLLGRLSLSTDSSGNVGFSATFASPGSAYSYVSSTATTVPASGLGVTSEFSVNVPINTAAGSTIKGTSSGTGSTGSTGAIGSTGTSSTGVTTSITVTASSATTSAATVTLPITATCSSATANPCTVTVTGTVSASTASASQVLAGAAAGHRRTRKPPVTVGRAEFKLAAGATAKVKLVLTGRGFALLRARKSLAVTVTAKVTGAGRTTTSKTFYVHVVYKAPAKVKKRR
jgi:hypothetical protein